MASPPPPKPIPSSILIVGSGVFGLSTAYSLATNPRFNSTLITLVDRLEFPAPDAASIDSSRIVRADYADISYAALALAAQEKWRDEWWGEGGVYHEPGLAVVCESGESETGGSGNGELGREYMRRSMANVTKLGLKAGRKSEGGEVEALETREDVRRAFCGDLGDGQGEAEEGGIGEFGYVNWRSGWADAEKAMRGLRAKVEETGRVEFVRGTVSRLVFERETEEVKGVVLQDEEETTLEAELVVLAAGAWTPALIDTRGVCSATGQALAYLPISDAEQEILLRNPTLLNESTGLFIIPPANNVLKVARHGYGYANPVTIPHPEGQALGEKETITVSLPRTRVTDPDLCIPAEADAACRSFLAAAIPALAKREFTHTRICWYADTAHGDWIISYHPKWKNLFVTTGGSGHAFKFMPVVGDAIVETVLGRTPEAFRGKWEWPQRAEMDQVWTEDWRGGVKGMILDEELRKN